ncbi:acetyl-CoA acetyltransferase [Citrobacter sp. NCU1]|uniref:acetyl-CoA C-acyltransferase n=1 Tax=Citrobacter sp. NCU1 TaxID=2026683 RepID=UPI001390F4E0|nr:acetyl-CoA acetyltransferase [Citrobacter sp. NCU1]
MVKVYIVAAKRTPVGCFKGALKTLSPARLGAEAVKAVLAQVQLAASVVDEVIVGNVIGAGQGMGVGRQVALAAGIPDRVPAYTLNMVCGSGMKAVMDACAHIKAGDAEVVIAAGTESMSQIPFTVPADIRCGIRPGHLELRDLLISDGLTDAFNRYHMGFTAENIARRLEISREEQDRFALASQRKAVAAVSQGRFVDEIVPVEVKSRSGLLTVAQDEHPRDGVTIEKLAALSPAFTDRGTVTAGNASGLNDGASAILVVSEAAVEKYHLQPLVEIESYHQVGVAPDVMGLGPVGACLGALGKAGLLIDNIDLCECNEAFAAQALGVIQEIARLTRTPAEALLARTNVNGGAIALGHPLGASGNRILVTLLYEMRRRGAGRGLATLCIGGGMGTAVILKNM